VLSSSRSQRARRLVVALVVTGSLPAGSATAGEPRFYPFDVPTVFFISKSDDRNRVDYAIHLDAHCVPTGDDAVFQYWREFENSPPVRIHTFGFFDNIAYGISEQRTIRPTPTGAVQVIKLRQFRTAVISIVTKQEAGGHCSAVARTVINGKDSELSYIYVKLSKGGLVPSVDYLDVHGKDPDTGQDVAQRLRK
jgi:hypothetical protein